MRENRFLFVGGCRQGEARDCAAALGKGGGGGDLATLIRHKREVGVFACCWSVPSWGKNKFVAEVFNDGKAQLFLVSLLLCNTNGDECRTVKMSVWSLQDLSGCSSMTAEARFSREMPQWICRLSCRLPSLWCQCRCHFWFVATARCCPECSRFPASGGVRGSLAGLLGRQGRAWRLSLQWLLCWGFVAERMQDGGWRLSGHGGRWLAWVPVVFAFSLTGIEPLGIRWKSRRRSWLNKCFSWRSRRVCRDIFFRTSQRLRSWFWGALMSGCFQALSSFHRRSCS